VTVIRDHLIGLPNMPFTGGPSESLNPAISRYCALSVGHEFDLSRSRDVIGHVTIAHMPFLLVVLKLEHLYP